MAGVSSGGLLTGLGPGSVRVFAVDHAGLRDTTGGVVQVRGMRLTVGTGSAYQGFSQDVSVTVTSLTSLSATSGQFTVRYDTTYVSCAGATPGALLTGYQFSVASRYDSGTYWTSTVSFASTAALSGAGELCRMTFKANPRRYTYSTSLQLTTAVFNETLTAARTSGSFTVNQLGNITVSPSAVTLLAGQTQQFQANGTFQPPLTWSVLNPVVATVNPTSGLVTAVSGGVTKVEATDAHGVIGVNSSLAVYDFELSLPASDIVVAPGMPVHVALTTDRDLGNLGIRSAQGTIAFSDAIVSSAGADSTGLLAVWGKPAGSGAQKAASFSAAGTSPLPHGTGGATVASVHFVIPPNTPSNRYIYITLQNVLFNEGHPSPQLGTGRIQLMPPINTFQLASPPDGSVFFYDQPPRLAWQAAVPYDPTDTLDHYLLTWWGGAVPAHGDTVLPASGTTFDFPRPPHDQPATYHWRITAVDVRGDTTQAVPAQGWSFSFTGNTPTGLSLEATPGEGSIIISWDVPADLNALGYRVYRRMPGSDWVCIDSDLPAGTGAVMRYEDTEAEPGVIYAYEVEVLGPSGPEGRWGPVQGQALSPTALSLRVEPNPGRGDLITSIELPQSGPVTLRLFDAAGREVWNREIDGLKPGRSEITSVPDGLGGCLLPSGAYWVRLETATGTRLARWVVIR